MERSTRQLLSQCHRSHHQRCHREPQYHQLQLYRHCQLQKSFLTLRLPLPPIIGWTPTHQIHHRKNMLFTPEIKGGFDVLVPCQMSDTEKSWKCFSHLTNWKAIANFVVGVLNFFDDPLTHSSSKKQLLPLCIPIRWWRCILHLPLSNLLWQWTFWEVLGATFNPSLENSWYLTTHEHPTLRRQGHFDRE